MLKKISGEKYRCFGRRQILTYTNGLRTERVNYHTEIIITQRNMCSILSQNVGLYIDLLYNSTALNLVWYCLVGSHRSQIIYLIIYNKITGVLSHYREEAVHTDLIAETQMRPWRLHTMQVLLGFVLPRTL